MAKDPNKKIAWKDLIKGNAAYIKLMPIWEKAHDCMMGEAQIKSKTTQYLSPIGTVMMQQGESGVKYRQFIRNAAFVNLSKNSHKSFVGSLTRKPADIENLDKSPLDKYKDDIDMSGTSIIQAMTKTIEEDLATARAGVMIQFPSQSGARSYPVPLQAHQILDEHKELRNGRMVYTFMKIRTVETRMNKEDTGYETFDVISVLTLTKNNEYHVAMYKQHKNSFFANTDGGGAIEMYNDFPLSNGKRVKEIPVRITGEGTDSLMQDIYDLQIHHYSASARLTRMLDKKASPWELITRGEKASASDSTSKKLEGAMDVGLDEAGIVLEHGADAKMIEFKGEGADALENDVSKYEKQISVMGAFHLADKTGGIESDAALKTRNVGQLSGLGQTASRVETVWTWALNFLQKHWDIGSKVNIKDIIVKINREYLPIDLDPQVLQALREGFANGCGSLTEIHNYLKRTGYTQKDFDGWLEDVNNHFASFGGVMDDDDNSPKDKE